MEYCINYLAEALLIRHLIPKMEQINILGISFKAKRSAKHLPIICLSFSQLLGNRFASRRFFNTRDVSRKFLLRQLMYLSFL